MAMGCVFADEILGRLDFHNRIEPDPILVEGAEFMTDYFEGLDNNLIMYFVPQQK